MTQPPMEYLDAGGLAPSPASAPVRPPRRWLPPLLGLAAFAVTLLLLGVLIGDAAARNAEMRALVTNIEQSEAAMGRLQDSVQGIAQQYQGQGQLSDADRAALDAALKAAAEKGRAEIAAAGRKVAGVRWLIWHRDVAAAQEAYLAHNRAWQDYLARAAKDPAEFGKQQDLINSSFAEAERKVRAAIPLIALFDLRDRIDAIFAPPPSDAGSGQSA